MTEVEKTRVSVDLETILDFVRSVRELGAREVKVGDVVVTFGPRALPAAPTPAPEKLPAEEQAKLDAERAREAEELVYYSAD